MANKKEPRIINPVPDGPLRKERELYRLLAEVWIRRKKRLMAEANPIGSDDTGGAV